MKTTNKPGKWQEIFTTNLLVRVAIARFLHHQLASIRVLSNFAPALLFLWNRWKIRREGCLEKKQRNPCSSAPKGKCFWASPTCSPLLPGCTRAPEEWFTTRASPWRSAPTNMSRKKLWFGLVGRIKHMNFTYVSNMHVVLMYIYISQSYKSYHILYIIYYIYSTHIDIYCMHIGFASQMSFYILTSGFFKNQFFIKKSSLKCPSFFSGWNNWLTNHVIFICTSNPPKLHWSPGYFTLPITKLGLISRSSKNRKTTGSAFLQQGEDPWQLQKIAGKFGPQETNCRANLDIRTTDHWNPGSTWHCKNGNVYHPFKLKKMHPDEKILFGALGCIKKFGLAMLYE